MSRYNVVTDIVHLNPSLVAEVSRDLDKGTTLLIFRTPFCAEFSGDKRKEYCWDRNGSLLDVSGEYPKPVKNLYFTPDIAFAIDDFRTNFDKSHGKKIVGRVCPDISL